MTDSTWARLRDDLWQLEGGPSDATRSRELAKQIAAICEGELPSGISGVHLRAGDHIAVIVLDGSDEYYRLILNFLAAGAENFLRDEYLSLELTEGRSVDEAGLLLKESIGALPETLDIRGWERNQADFEPEHFSREGIWQAMDSEWERLKDSPGSVLRVASEDCSSFMAWLQNPVDYLDYEHELASDLGKRLRGHDFLQLCCFKQSVLRRLDDRGQLNYESTILDLALSHSETIVVTEQTVLHGSSALRALLKHAWPPHNINTLVKALLVSKKLVTH